MKLADALPDWADDFRNPPAAFRPMPLWVWNGRMSPATASRTLERMAELGLGGVFIHPRAGMLTEFLSEDWFAQWGHALEECTRLGLECHLYDENSFPSGFAGGHLGANHPELSAVALSATYWDHPYRPHLHPAEEGQLAAFRISPEGQWLGPASPDNLEQASPERPVVIFDLLREPASQWTAGFPYVDLLHPGTTRHFLDLVHEPHAQRFRHAMGTVWKYAFTDEPTLERTLGLACSRFVLAEFAQEYGYDLTSRLEGLAFDVPGAEAVRYDYFRLLDRMFTRNYCARIAEWCDRRGIAFTGHFNEHAWPRPDGLPSTLSALRWMQVPGNDLLGFQFRPTSLDDNVTWLRNLKELSSVAGQLGRERVLAESCGGGGYDMAPRDFKPLEDFLLVHGVNLFSPHFSTQTVVGIRKYDWPQTFSQHAAWWEASRPHQDHVARTALALSQGQEINRVLVLMPDTTAWIRWKLSLRKPGEICPACELPDLKAGMDDLVLRLTRAHCDFDFGGEALLEEMGRVEGRYLVCGQGRYELFCLPAATENIPSALLPLMESFLAGGGRILSSPRLPRFVDGRPSDALRHLADQFPQHWIQSDGDLAEAAVALVPPRLRVSSASHPDLLIRRVETPDSRVMYFLANPWDRSFEGTLTFDSIPACSLNTGTGEMETFAGASTASLKIGPRGHLLLLSGTPAPPQIRPSGLQPLSLSEPKVAALAPNVLVLDYCDLTTPSFERRDVPTAVADDLHWQANGLSRNPWWFAIQFRRNTIERTFPKPARLEWTYAFSIAAPERIPLRLALERAELYAIQVNGQAVDPSQAERWLDENIRAVDITPLTRPGDNRITVSPLQLTTECEIAPAYVLGNFHLAPASRGFEIHSPQTLRPGDWTQNGRPFYSGWLRYEWAFFLNEPARALWATLEEWSGTAARVSLDGGPACDLVHEPFRAHLAGPIAAGAHRLTIDVAGNPRNLFGPHFSDGLPLHWTWTQCPAACPPGTAYRLLPSGLTRVTLQQELP
jgi:hypothetical protein